jgi:hypothetical protein
MANSNEYYKIKEIFKKTGFIEIELSGHVG